MGWGKGDTPRVRNEIAGAVWWFERSDVRLLGTTHREIKKQHLFRVIWSFSRFPSRKQTLDSQPWERGVLRILFLTHLNKLSSYLEF